MGSDVAEIGKILGAGSITGIAGGPEKCAKLLTTMHYDQAIDYIDADPANAEKKYMQRTKARLEEAKVELRQPKEQETEKEEPDDPTL